MSDTLEERSRADPDDIASWLVYGDWLVEQDDERGLLPQAPPCEPTKEEKERSRGIIPEPTNYDAARNHVSRYTLLLYSTGGRGSPALATEAETRKYVRAQTRLGLRLEPAPIAILGEEIFLDASRFVVDDERIHVLSTRRLAPVHFAARQTIVDGASFVDIDVFVRSTAAAHHLMFDFFRNAWAASHSEYEMPVPRIGARPVVDGV